MNEHDVLRFRIALTLYGWSQSRFAREIGVSAVTVCLCLQNPRTSARISKAIADFTSRVLAEKGMAGVSFKKAA